MSTNTNSLKLSYNNEVHRISNRPQTLKLLLKAVTEVFPDIRKESADTKVSLKYEDSEGDMIVIASEDDYQTALASSESEGKSLKIFVDSEGNGVLSSLLLKSFDMKAESDKKEVISKQDEVVIEDEVIEQQPQILASKEEENHQHQGEYEKKTPHKEKCHRFRFERKLSKLRELTRQTLQEELPTIAMIVKQMLEDPSAQQQPQPQPQSKSNANKAVHHRVRCDVCKVSPIVGVRYKCTVLHNYDLCENCEARVDHPYPLLKLKHEAQRAIKVAVMMPEQATQHRHAEHHGFRRCHKKPMHWEKREEGESGPRCHGFQKFFGGLLQNLNNPEETEKISKAFKDGFGNFQEAFKDLTTQLEQTISPQNTKDSAKEETKQEAPKKETTVETSKSNDGDDRKRDIEEKSTKRPESDSSFVEKLSEKPAVEKTQPIDNSLTGGNEEGKVKAVDYTSDVLNKAKVVLDIFPQCKLEDVCEVVKQSPKKTVEELVQDFLASL